jgi:hypothetical protein
MHFRLIIPRPEHTGSSLQEQPEWKKAIGDQGRRNTNGTPRIRRGSMGSA